MHEIANGQHRLLVVAHGTASPAGRATTEQLVAAVGAQRPATRVDLCFLDVVEPRLPDSLDDRATVLVPLLLSTGYHVQTDIPGAVSEHPAVRIARHLGPDPLLVDVLLDRLGVLLPGASVALVGAGSSRTAAADELHATGTLLQERIGRTVAVLTMADDLAAELDALPRPVAVATYLLAGGQFVDTLRTAANGRATVADPLGVHPALVELVWRRYDEGVRWAGPVGSAPDVPRG